MAETAVKSAADWLGKLLVEEGKYLWGAEGKMEELRDELVWMQGFLRDADTIQYDDEIVRTWVFQIKEFVSEAEDIIDDFVIRIASRRRLFGWKNKLRRYSCFLWELVALHQVASGIDALKTSISMLSPRLEKYGLRTSYGVKTYRTRDAQAEQIQQSLKYRHLDKENIVGLEENTREIADALIKSEPGRRVIAIHGMGGLGKTTLAIKVCDHEEIRKHFRDGRAWAYVSQQLQIQSVLQVLLANLTVNSNEMFSGKTVAEMISQLQELLGRSKCLVVLDDVWKQADWEILKAAFITCGESGSKVLLTTRKEDIARYVDGDALHKPDSLKKDKSLELLLRTVGWIKMKGHKSTEPDIDQGSSGHGRNQTESVGSSIEADMHGSDGLRGAQTEKVGTRDVPEMIKLAEEMVEQCNGLPLAIIVLGGILRKKDNIDEWRAVHKNIISYLRRGSDHGKTFMEVLIQSYYDLPYHLKPCFLHLGNFPEDYEICTEKLYRMWMVEGLVSWPRDKIAGTESLEDVANDYLSELAQSGMVEIMKKRSDGKIKSVRMHDLMRDVCLQKAAEENFVNTIDHRPCLDKPQSVTSYYSHKRLLRMAIYLAPGVESFIPDSLSSKAHKYLRSLLLIDGNEGEQVGSSSPPDLFTSKCHGNLRHVFGHRVPQNKYQVWLKRICCDFPWLRVLDFEGLYLEGKLTSQIQNLTHLRYLSLKETKVSELPSSIGNLRFLEILDLRVSFSGSFVILPNVFWKLHQLRHLLLPSITYEIKKSGNLRLDTLGFLESLQNLEFSNSRLGDLRKLGNLRKLSVKGVISQMTSLEDIIESPALKSGSLQSCSLSVKGMLISEKPDILSSGNCIHRLKIVEQISAGGRDVAFPVFLKALHLEYCKLVDDPMRILGSLCNLKDLFMGVECFVGTQMHCEAQSFPSLKKLNLRGLVDLEFWTLDQGSMAMLEVLKISDCVNLKRIPDLLPSSTLHITCSPCISGIENYGTCVCYNASSSVSVRDLFVGRQDDIDVLTNQLLDDDVKDVFLISGMEGIGKACLAKMIYRNPSIRKHFDAVAWACFPKDTRCPLRRSLQGIMRDLKPEISTEYLSYMRQDILIEEIRRVTTQKKCLIISLVYAVNHKLPDLVETLLQLCSRSASKLLLATRGNSPQTESMETIAPYYPKPLNPSDSWELFIKTATGTPGGNDAYMKAKMAEEMMRCCEGCPSSIRMLAGLLETKDTILEWENINKEISSYTTDDCHRMHDYVSSLCYQNLPSHLRSCFLYLANFAEGAEINTEKLYQMWIAAGLVKLKDDGDQTDEFLENLAESYLAELIRRGLVKAEQRKPSGRTKTCRLQYASYHLCLQTAEQKGGLAVLNQSDSTFVFGQPTTQYVAVFLYEPENNELFSRLSCEGLHSAKSIHFFPSLTYPLCEGENWAWFTIICSFFRSLLVLDLEDMWTTVGDLPADIRNLQQLRYLSLRGTWVSVLPSSIGELRKLQTLDLRVLIPLTIPDVLWKLKCLRHLYFPNSIYLQRGKLRLLELDQMQTLVNLHTDKVDLNHVPQLKHLRKISIRKIHEEAEVDDLLAFVGTSLDLSIKSEAIYDDPTILCGVRMIKMKMKGEIGFLLIRPSMFPACVRELTLKHTKIEEDPIPVLEKLHYLKRLSFDHESYMGKQMTFSGNLPELTHLSFRRLSNLEELNDPQGAMHVLQSLVITNCWCLQSDKVQLRSLYNPVFNF